MKNNNWTGKAALCAVMFATALSATPAFASSISPSDTFNPVDVLMDGQVGTICTSTNTVVTDTTSAATCGSLSWTHVLAGFNSVTDTLTAANVTLTMYNFPTANNTQKFDWVFDALSGTNVSVPDGSTVGAPFTFGLSVLSQVSVDGTLVVTLTSNNGNHDFYFGQSVLSAEGTRRDTEVGTAPAVAEPGSLVLLGSGLLLLAGYARQRYQHT